MGYYNFHLLVICSVNLKFASLLLIRGWDRRIKIIKLIQNIFLHATAHWQFCENIRAAARKKISCINFIIFILLSQTLINGKLANFKFTEQEVGSYNNPHRSKTYKLPVQNRNVNRSALWECACEITCTVCFIIAKWQSPAAPHACSFLGTVLLFKPAQSEIHNFISLFLIG